jgi:carboxyl-terminal processing protease
MKNTFKIIFLFLSTLFVLESCQDNNDVVQAPPADIAVQDFVLRGLNQYYLWQTDVPNLADNRFGSQNERNVFLFGFAKPESLFQDLLYKPKSKFPNTGEAVDRFSLIVSDYVQLEQRLNGIEKSSGIDFRLNLIAEGSNDVLGYVRYIVPNSDAATKDIKRGDVFTKVNGTQLTVSNYEALLFGTDSFTLNKLDFDGTNFVDNGKTVTLNKTVLEENPILINKTIDSGTHKIGYLMYNGFYPASDLNLNSAFGKLKSDGVTELVLDLRYNLGGSVQSAIQLASMITGKFNGKLFLKEQWNPKISSYYESNFPDKLIENFVDKIGSIPINSLNLSKIYILTSKGTASASELIINGLKPYITVIQIGDITVGKNVASITLYDSTNFKKENSNPNHKYAMQPIVLKTVNAAGFGDYANGLLPSIKIIESPKNLGILGDITEPLLKVAIDNINGISAARISQQNKVEQFPYFGDSKSLTGRNNMYVGFK